LIYTPRSHRHSLTDVLTLIHTNQSINPQSIDKFVLTVLFVQQNFHLFLHHGFKGMVGLGDSLFVRQLAVHEGTGATLLHHFCTVVSGQLAKAIVAVNNGVVHDAGVGQYKTTVCNVQCLCTHIKTGMKFK